MNPSEILNSRAFADLLVTLREHFDYIVMDSPASIRLTDARILATLSDATVLALEANPSRPDAEQAVEGLRSVGANLVGMVVTNLERDEKNWGVDCNDAEVSALAVAPDGVTVAIADTSGRAHLLRLPRFWLGDRYGHRRRC